MTLQTMTPGGLRIYTLGFVTRIDNNEFMNAHAKAIRDCVSNDAPSLALEYLSELDSDIEMFKQASHQLRRCLEAMAQQKRGDA